MFQLYSDFDESDKKGGENMTLKEVELMDKIRFYQDEIKRLEVIINELFIENCKLKEAKYGMNWETLRSFLKEYRLQKTGSNEDGRYAVSLSVTDLLDAMESIDRGKWPKI